ncbi:MAG: FAD-binding oxidoreductase [Kiritimatiellae bacterium]|nr:FAD-binding oxidoreductase [Kiritimatiellia bacterium]
MKSYLERLAWGTDAGFYRFVPEEVLMPADEADVQAVVARARREGKSITFRAAGTSLSGQATGNSLLVVCGKKWEGAEVLDGGARIRMQPGIVGGRVNELLKPYGRRFTPDPASVNSAMVGGIVANNASGMCCGTHANSYRMLESVRLVLADGTVLDTGDAASRASFAETHPAFLARICELRDRTRSDAELSELIRRKYSIKNVTGLTILPFVEFEDPFDIIAHLIPGSEGTLAFLASVTMRTGEIPACSESALLLFSTTRSACEAVSAMKPTGALSAAEFFDRKAMRTVEGDFPELAGLPDDAGAVLVRIDGADAAEIAAKRATLTDVLAGFELAAPADFTDDPARTGKWWAMRSGIFPAVGGTREIGTTCLIEDIAVPVDRLAELTLELQALFREHGYPGTVIYGHALEGNWHFILNQRFDTSESVAQYDGMMRAVVDLVTRKYKGSLKAEHGTGRNMAPFVRQEWGDAAYGLMKDVKALFDPDGIFNPGVIFNEDPKAYISNLKPLPRVHEIVDRCIECGFCEVNCVACGFSMSSRQRIVVQREIARLEGLDDPRSRALAKELKRDFRKLGKNLCAGDGLCSTSCPVKINTGDFIHVLREREMPLLGRSFGRFAADHLAFVAWGVGCLLDLAALGQAVLGNKLMFAVCKALHRGSFGLIPLWTPAMPHRVRGFRPGAGRAEAPAGKVVYFPSCINQRMGPAKGDVSGKPLVNEMTELMEKAGYEVVFPANMRNLCCGTTWESKGMPEVADRKAAELGAALREASENGRWPVVCDQSPCLYRMRHTIKDMHLYEPFEFIEKFVLDRVDIEPVDACVAIHPTCSMRKMGLIPSMLKVAKACARKVALPEDVGCCAFAGDKGFTDPKMNAWALRKLRGRIVEAGATEGYSNSRTCEIGLTLHSGIPYSGIAVLVNRVAKAKGGAGAAAPDRAEERSA